MNELDNSTRLTVAERMIGELQEGQRAIVTELKHISTVLGKQGPGLMESAKLVVIGIAIFSAVVTGIVQLTRYVSAADYYVVNTRMQQEAFALEKRLLRAELLIELRLASK